MPRSPRYLVTKFNSASRGRCSVVLQTVSYKHRFIRRLSAFRGEVKHLYIFRLKLFSQCKILGRGVCPVIYLSAVNCLKMSLFKQSTGKI